MEGLRARLRFFSFFPFLSFLASLLDVLLDVFRLSDLLDALCAGSFSVFSVALWKAVSPPHDASQRGATEGRAICHQGYPACWVAPKDHAPRGQEVCVCSQCCQPAGGLWVPMV